MRKTLYYQVGQSITFLEISSRNPRGAEVRRISEAAQVKVEIYEISVF